MLHNKKILVTGGAGFIGSNLIAKLLDLDNELVCLDNFLTGKPENIAEFKANKRFRLIEGDIRSAADCASAVAGVDYVFHQAALGSVPRSIKDPITTNDINISGFVQILNASVAAGVKRFVYAASSSTYGDHPALPKVEENIGRPLSPYAVTKYVNELYARVFSDLYGIETIGLRYFNVFGPKQDPNGAYAAVIPKFIQLLMNHQAPVINGDGSHSRDFTFIDNVVQANLKAATVSNPEALNTVYNIAFGQQTTLNQLIEYLTQALSAYDAAIATIKAIHGPNRMGDILHSLASTQKAQDLLHYTPEVSVADGLKKTVDWYWKR